MYSFGTYTRETETLRWSSISLTSFRASSTGWTFDLKARPNTPSKRDSSFDSMLRRTLIQAPERLPDQCRDTIWARSSARAALIKYIGSKRTLVPLIESVAAQLPVRSACDLFAGTTRVGQALRRLGLAVHSNDLATYSEALGRAYIEAGPRRSTARGSRRSSAELAALEGRDGWFTEAFCRRSRYFQPANGARIEAIREAIEGYGLPPVERAVLLTALLAGRRPGGQHDRPPDGLPQVLGAPVLQRPRSCGCPRRCRGRRGASRASTRTSSHLPSTSTSSTSTLPTTSTRSSRTTTSGRPSCAGTIPRPTGSPASGSTAASTGAPTTRSGRRPRRSPGCSASIPARWLLVSVSDEGFHDAAELEQLLGGLGYVGRIDVDSKRYVGAQIGIYNPSGEKVGTISRLRNRESLFLVGPDRGVVESAVGVGLSCLSASGPAARKAAVTQAAATSGRNGAAGAPSPVATISAEPPSAAGHGPRPRT